MTSGRRAALRRALRIAGTLSLLALTALWVDLDAVVNELRRAEPLPLALALALSVPLVLVLAGRWSFTARRMGVDMPFSVAVGEYMWYGSCLACGRCWIQILSGCAALVLWKRLQTEVLTLLFPQRMY